MIWLISLFLIALFAWLLLNGINEKQWVDAHMHDENVASDKGLFASFTALGEGDANDKVGNVVSNIKKKSAEASSKLGEKISDAKQSDAYGKMREKTTGIREKSNDVRQRVQTRVQNEVQNEDSMLNKAKANVAGGVDKMGKKVGEKMNKDKQNDAG